MWPPEPYWGKEDSYFEAFKPTEIPSPPAHLVEGNREGPRFSEKPKLPQHHRAITRPTGFLLPFTHPLTDDEVAAVHRSGRLQDALRKTVTAADMHKTMYLLVKEARKMGHLKANAAWSYWLENARKELKSHGEACPRDVVEHLKAWLRRYGSAKALFAGLLMSHPDHNVVVCPVEYHIYNTELKNQKAATAKAQGKIDAWETKHGEASRAHAKWCKDWEEYALSKANAIAYCDIATKDQNTPRPQSYVYEEVRETMNEDPDLPDFSFFFCDPDTVGKDKLRSMKHKAASVAKELKRYTTEYKNVSPFDAQILLTNAKNACDAYVERLRKEIEKAKKLENDSHIWNRAYADKRVRLSFERGAFKDKQKYIEAAAIKAYNETLHAASAHGYLTSDNGLGDRRLWTPWVKAIMHIVDRGEKASHELKRRSGRLKTIESNYGKLASDLGGILEAQERAFAALPQPEPERDSDDDDDVVFTDVVTRAERDAEGWKVAEVLE